MADFKVTASQLNTQAESLQDLNGRFKSAIEQLVTSETSLKSMRSEEHTSELHSIATRYEQTERTNTEIASNRTY